MIVLQGGPPVDVDVDDTLIVWDNSPDTDKRKSDSIFIICNGVGAYYTPNEYNIQYLKEFAKRGHLITVQSKSGVQWAEAVVKALNLEDYVAMVRAKPFYYIDDKPCQEWMGPRRFYNLDGERQED